MPRKYTGTHLFGKLAAVDGSLEIDDAVIASPTLNTPTLASPTLTGTVAMDSTTVTGAVTASGAITASGSLKSTENLPAAGDSLVSGETVTPNTLVTLTTDRERSVRHVRLTLAELSVAITAANDYGGTKICDLPDKNIMILACECDLVLTKGNVTNGLEADTDINTAIGTAVASASTLATTMIDVVDIVLNTASSLTHDMDAHSQANSPANMPLEVADSASAALYLNLAAAITADDAMTASGTIDLFYFDLGNVTS